MDIWHLLHVLVKRWYVVLPLLALTAAAAVTTTSRIDPTYAAGATVLLVSQAPTSDTPSTPLNTVGASQAFTVSTMSQETRLKIAEKGLSPAYTVASRPRTSIIDIKVEAGDPSLAVETVEAVLDNAPAEFAARPAVYGSPTGSRAALEILAQPALVSATYEGRSRVLTIILVLGACLTLAAAYLVEALSRRGRPRRARADRAVQSAASEQTAAAERSVDDRLLQPTARGAGTASTAPESPLDQRGNR